MTSRTHITAVYFSPTHTTKTLCETIAKEISLTLGIPWESRSFTLPAERTEPLQFDPTALVIFGVPVYAGRVPNFLGKYISQTVGNNAMAIPVVVYGNRAYDDALIELRDMLETSQLHTVAAAAFIGEHSFSRILAKGRPDSQDLDKARRFAQAAASVIEQNQYHTPIAVKGNVPYRPYMVPQKKDGGHKTITKVFPKINDTCTNCGVCVQVCPMGAIAPDCHSYTHFCIKCCACVKACPVNARYYDDETYLFHKKQLEEQFARRAEPETFI